MKNLALILLFSIALSSCKTSSMENHLIIKDSPLSIDETYSNLRTLVSNNPNLKILLELDHSANAASVGLELNPTKIIMFGNPKLGTPLMQASQTASIDLPQKVIVYTADDGSCKVAYNDPIYLIERHNIQGNEEVIKTISGALNNITNKAIGN